MYQSRIQNKKKRAGRFEKKRDLELPEAEDGTYFAIVKDMLGNGRVRVFCENGDLKVARIRGNMRKSRGKTIIDRNDLVIVSGRDYEDKMDILHKYRPEEVAIILRDYEIPEKIYKSLTESDFGRVDGTDDMIIFCDKNEDDKVDDEDNDDDEEDDTKKQAEKEEELDIEAI